MIVSDLLQTPGLSLERIVGGPDRSSVESVFLAERLFDLMDAPGRSVVVLSADACAGAEQYHFDMALRMAASRDVAAIILTRAPVGGTTSTSLHTARRVGVTLLRQTEPINLAGLIVALEARIRGSAELGLRRAVQAFEAMSRAPGEVGALVSRVGAAAAADIVLTDQPDAELSFPVELEAERNAWIVVRGATAQARPELALVGKALADRVAVVTAAARRAEELPIRSRAELLSEMLDSTSSVPSALLRRARAMGLPIDGWHLVTRIEHANSEELWEDEVRAYEGQEHITRLLLDAVRSGGGIWHTARASDAVILIRMFRKDPGPHAVPGAMKAADRALHVTSQQFARAVLYCGVGTVHLGATGLINSAAEARAAVAASRARNRPNAATAFDSLGLRRTLIEWYGSQNAREAVEKVLEPLDRLGGKKAEEAIKTLHAFLDVRGSLSRAAEVLHLHRNAVAYRIDRIFSQLEVDRENPDDWLLLELACRARRLG
ncbi:MAG: helix-turn-helix domain-containing protein [Nocardiopsaceae bacterium]|jgi:sugar diacid utilization regulator|nr:helix-turn-helix domain-containing protein [Nocardiopsaceae bacterium]